MKLAYTCMDDWPPLAWLATCQPGDAAEVMHGPRVETRPDWFAEAVWEGDFAEGEFDRTDLVYGSGGRVRADGLTFVSAASTVDRLHSLEVDGRVYVSNSLACLLAAAGASVAPGYTRYYRDFETITRGVRDYRRTLATSAGPARLTYFDDLRWAEGRLVEVPKPYPKRDVGTFAAYREFLESSLCRLADNMRSAARSYPYQLVATISSGYDSPTVAAVARRAGLEQTLSFSQSREGRPDSGAEIARRLGLEPIVADSRAWRDSPLSEVPFIASDAKGEDVYYAGAEEILRGRVLLTGYGGSMVWDKEPLPPDILQRSDQSGLSLCEYRLRAGFLHCPVTFLGGRQTDDLGRISNGPEMAPWDVGGSYTRPICRRILEEADVPRELFGMEKKAASVLLFDRNSFLSEASRRDYIGWLERALPRRGDPVRLAANGLSAGARAAARGLQALAGVLPGRLAARVRKSGRLTAFGRHERLFEHVFPWALEHAMRRYRRPRRGSALAEARTRAISEEAGVS